VRLERTTGRSQGRIRCRARKHDLVGPAGGDATVHGTARAGFKTWADECAGFKDAVSEACLAHVEGDKVKAAYACGEFEQQRRELMEAWSRYCAAPPIDTSNNIVPLRSE
jgi:hypothetical protein